MDLGPPPDVTLAHDIVLPLVDRYLPDCPETEGITCAELPAIDPLMMILPTVRVPFTVIEPELRLSPPEPDRSLIEDTLRVLIDYFVSFVVIYIK